MSLLMDNPSPTPSPVGLVVKKGSKILAAAESGIPKPLSEISTNNPFGASLVAILTVGV